MLCTTGQISKIEGHIFVDSIEKILIKSLKKTDLFICWIIRKILFIPNPKISKDEALKIAIFECRNKDISMNSPKIYEHLKYWSVCVDSVFFRNSVRIQICNQTGKILRYIKPLSK